MESKCKQCGPNQRELRGTIDADGDVRVAWCPGGLRQPCDSLSPELNDYTPCPHSLATIGLGHHTAMVCCSYGLEDGDGDGQWGVPDLPACDTPVAVPA